MRGRPSEALHALMDPASSTTILGPAREVEIMDSSPGKQVSIMNCVAVLSSRILLVLRTIGLCAVTTLMHRVANHTQYTIKHICRCFAFRCKRAASSAPASRRARRL